jgi:hypothetical protein
MNDGTRLKTASWKDGRPFLGSYALVASRLHFCEFVIRFLDGSIDARDCGCPKPSKDFDNEKKIHD